MCVVCVGSEALSARCGGEPADAGPKSSPGPPRASRGKALPSHGEDSPGEGRDGLAWADVLAVAADETRALAANKCCMKVATEWLRNSARPLRSSVSAAGGPSGIC